MTKQGGWSTDYELGQPVKFYNVLNGNKVGVHSLLFFSIRASSTHFNANSVECSCVHFIFICVAWPGHLLHLRPPFKSHAFSHQKHVTAFLLRYCVLWLGHKGVALLLVNRFVCCHSSLYYSFAGTQQAEGSQQKLACKVFVTLLMQIELNCSIYGAFYAIIMALCLTPCIDRLFLYPRAACKNFTPIKILHYLHTLRPSCNKYFSTSTRVAWPQFVSHYEICPKKWMEWNCPIWYDEEELQTILSILRAFT